MKHLTDIPIHEREVRFWTALKRDIECISLDQLHSAVWPDLPRFVAQDRLLQMKAKDLVSIRRAQVPSGMGEAAPWFWHQCGEPASDFFCVMTDIGDEIRARDAACFPTEVIAISAFGRRAWRRAETCDCCSARILTRQLRLAHIDVQRILQAPERHLWCAGRAVARAVRGHPRQLPDATIDRSLAIKIVDADFDGVDLERFHRLCEAHYFDYELW